MGHFYFGDQHTGWVTITSALTAQRILVMFQAQPAWFGFSFKPPLDSRRVRFRHDKDFVNSILSRAAGLEVERHTPFRLDSPYLIERNLREGQKALTGRRILLVGAGAIGGHLAHALARAGAGYGGGSLRVTDPQIFTGGNLGRHRLGVEALLRSKAEALADDIKRSLPGIDVEAIVGSALEVPLKAFDLVVDATGEEQLSEALNARFVSGDSAPIIFTWINGNGSAVQSFTLADPEQACLQCWKTHGDRRSFVPLDEASLEVRVGRGCDDPYAPFSGAAPLVAAGVGIQAVLDWASGQPRPTLRSVQLEYGATHPVAPKSPSKSKQCPACGPTR